MYLFCVLEVGTVNAGGRNTHWVYGADVGRVSGSEKCSHPTQAVTSFRTLLVVAASVVEKFEKEIQVRVTNFGLIIPKESLERIFERFYRVEDSRSMQTGGTGLGLNIARQIVVLHGGMIKVESDIDGTIFTIALPLEKAEKDKERLVNITE